PHVLTPYSISGSATRSTTTRPSPARTTRSCTDRGRTRRTPTGSTPTCGSIEGSSGPFSARTNSDKIAAMPRYLIVRHFEVDEAQMPPIARRSRELVDGEFPEITWEHSHVVVDDEGLVQTFCVYDAP